MSRLIVKGLPKKTTAEALQEHFSQFGQTTDVKLVYTRDGVFRRFGFVGYATEKQATEAMEYFNHTYMGSSRIEVQVAKPYGDSNIPRPWSKYSKGSSGYKMKDGSTSDAAEKVGVAATDGEKDHVIKACLNRAKHKSKLVGMLEEYYQLSEDDPQFAEFMASHKKKSGTVWSNDEGGLATVMRGAKTAREEEEEEEEEEEDSVPAPAPENGEANEPIAESGRLFIRNLSYSITEEDLSELFSQYGPLTEHTLLVDKHTNKPIGLAYVTFMFPEHALKAVKELDGQVFQGRLLHLLPSQPRRVKQEQSEEWNGANSSFKKKKVKELRSSAGRAHNWNSLFLGANAVVDAMADQYSTEKSTILDTDSSHSLAVRMALGETQLVADTREFMEQHGVRLEVFDQEKPKRSKTIILVKNLPYGTTAGKLRALFSKHGTLNSVIVPPHGVSGLVEFSAGSSARKAFSELAYSSINQVPLYLEWAPIGVLGSQRKPSHKQSVKAVDKEEDQSNRKQKSSKIIVKNIPFEATRKEVRELFTAFGQLKVVRLPQKYGHQPGEHRGFGFVEFVSKEDAKRALESLKHSTHLYGRRLVMEWAAADESIEDVRKRTAKHYHETAGPAMKKRSVEQLLSSLDEDTDT